MVPQKVVNLYPVNLNPQQYENTNIDENSSVDLQDEDIDSPIESFGRQYFYFHLYVFFR